MRVTITVLLLLLFFALPASAAVMDRNAEMDFTGEINLLSQTAAGEAEAVVEVHGYGHLRGATMSEVSAEQVDHNVSLYLESSDRRSVTGNYLWRLEAILGARFADGQHYVSKVIPGGGQDGELLMLFKVVPGDIHTLDLTKEARVADGVYQRYIELADEDISLSEVMKVVGRGWIKDHIRFSSEAE